MMGRWMTRFALVFGAITLGLTVLLALLRRDAPADWVVFSTKPPDQNQWGIYRQRLDGSHYAKIGTSDALSATFGQIWVTGWLAVNEDFDGSLAYRLVRLDGLSETVVAGDYDGITLLSYDMAAGLAQVSVMSNYRTGETASYTVDVRTGEMTPLAQTFPSYDQRGELANGDPIYWVAKGMDTNHGDFYYVHDGQSIPLTTRGDILRYSVPLDAPGWLYFYADTLQLALHRMRLDDGETQVLASDVQLPERAITFFGQNVLYYWAGEADDVHLVQAKLDGTDRKVLPVTPIEGWQATPIEGTSLVYYLQPDMLISHTFQSLHRLNLVTGEDVTLLEDQSVARVQWTPNREWLLVWAEVSGPYNASYDLIAMRPDGSEQRVLLPDVTPYYTFASADGHQLVFGSGTSLNDWVRVLDLATFKVHQLHDAAPRHRPRWIYGVTTPPNLEWQAGWLIGLSVLGLAFGLAGWRRA